MSTVDFVRSILALKSDEREYTVYYIQECTLFSNPSQVTSATLWDRSNSLSRLSPIPLRSLFSASPMTKLLIFDISFMAFTVKWKNMIKSMCDVVVYFWHIWEIFRVRKLTLMLTITIFEQNNLSLKQFFKKCIFTKAIWLKQFLTKSRSR